MRPGSLSRGFTLIELMLSMALIGLLVGITLPIFASFQTRTGLDATTQSLAEAVRRAQADARGVAGDSQWGVEITATTATLFKGSTFSGHDTNYDEVITFPASVTASGLSEVIFAKLSGDPNATGTVTLTATTGDTRTISVNAKGTVIY